MLALTITPFMYTELHLPMPTLKQSPECNGDTLQPLCGSEESDRREDNARCDKEPCESGRLVRRRAEEGEACDCGERTERLDDLTPLPFLRLEELRALGEHLHVEVRVGARPLAVDGALVAPRVVVGAPRAAVGAPRTH